MHASSEGAQFHLAQAHELKDLAGLRVNGVDTLDANHEHDLGFGLHVEVALLLGITALGDDVVITKAFGTVFTHETIISDVMYPGAVI